MALNLIGERIVRVPINIYHHVVPETHLYPYKGLWSVHEAKIVNAERPLSTFTKMSHRRYLVALELRCINQIHTIQQVIVMKLRKICHWHRIHLSWNITGCWNQIDNDLSCVILGLLRKLLDMWISHPDASMITDTMLFFLTYSATESLEQSVKSIYI